MEVVLDVIYSYRSFGVNTQFPGGGGGGATKELQEGDIDACYTHARNANAYTQKETMY